MNQMQLTYRLGTHHDLDKLKELGMRAYGAYQADLLPDYWAQMHAFLSDDQSYINLLKQSTCFVCEEGQELVGMAFLVSKGHPTDIFDKEWCYIRMVGVHPAHNGKGIGKRLTQLCIDEARLNQEDMIALHTSEFMSAARHIYRQMGFQEVSELVPRYGKRYWLYTMDLRTEIVQ